MSNYNPWLAQLAAAGKGPVTLYASRGRPLSRTVVMSGNRTDCSFRGQVRLEPDATAALATFTCTAPVLVGDTTQFTFSLAAGSGANSTGSLPADDAGQTYIELPFDILMTKPGFGEDLFFGGLINMVGRITA